MTDGQREIFFAGVMTERNRIVRLLKKSAEEKCDEFFHVVDSTCLCEILALIKGEKK